MTSEATPDFEVIIKDIALKVRKYKLTHLSSQHMRKNSNQSMRNNHLPEQRCVSFRFQVVA